MIARDTCLFLFDDTILLIIASGAVKLTKRGDGVLVLALVLDHPQLHELVRGVDVLVAGELGFRQVVSEELCRVVGPVLHSSLSQSLLAFRGIHGHIHTVVEVSELWVANRMAARPEVGSVGDAHVLTNLAFELGEDLVLRRVLEVDGFGGDRNGGGSDEEGSLHFSVW